MDGKIVEKKSRLKIIGPIEQQRKSAQQLFRILRAEIGDDASDVHIRVDLAQSPLSRHGFRQGFQRI